MSASTEELIAINSLLIEREAEFARVHSIEAQISELLGAEYPFDPPEVIVPSTITKKPTKAKKAAKVAPQVTNLKHKDSSPVARAPWAGS